MQKFAIFEIYRPPRSNPNDFLEQLDLLLNNLHTTQYEEVFICGDHNLNLLDVEANTTSQFLNQMASYSLLPVISRPTRITEQTSTLIDNIFIKHPINFHTGLIISTVSDHLPIFIIKTLNSSGFEMLPPKTVRFRPINDRKITLFRERLGLENFEHIINQNNIDAAWLAFARKFFQIYEQVFPVQTKTFSPKSDIKPWINRDIVGKIKKRNILYVKLLQGKISKTDYNSVRNQVTADIRRAKKNSIKTSSLGTDLI